jgi:hypothetical protein
MKIITRCAMALAAAALIAGSAAGAASAKPGPPGETTLGAIVPAGKPTWCLSAPVGRAGTLAAISKCNLHKVQRWRLNRIEGILNIQSVAWPNLCLGAARRGNGVALISCASETKGWPLQLTMVKGSTGIQLRATGKLMSVQTKLDNIHRSYAARWQDESDSLIQQWRLPRWRKIT